MDIQEEEKIPPNERSRNEKWRRRLRINRKLLALKFLIFIMNGATSVLYPFFIIHCLSMGLTLTESGIVFALIPVFGCFGNPLAGFLADKLGDYKKVVISFIFLSVICHGLLGFAVPIYSKKTGFFSHNFTTASLDIKCSSTENSQIFINFQPILNSKIDQGCTITKRPNSNSTQNLIKFCQNNCPTENQQICLGQSTDHHATDRHQTNSHLTNHHVTDRHCFGFKELEKINFLNLPKIVQIENSTFWTLGEFNVTFPKGTEEREQTKQKERMEHTEQKEQKERAERTSGVLNCPQEKVAMCSVVCQLEIEEIFLVCEKTEISGNRLTTFFLYTLFRVFGAMAVSGVMMLIDAAALLMVKQHRGDFGIQRIFGLVGNLVFPPLAGFLIEIATESNELKKPNFSPIFYLFCSMFSVGAVTTCLMDLHIKPPGKQIWSNVWNLMKNVKVSSFVIVMFLVGCFYGILENYLFWYMQTFLKSPKWLLGMTNTVAGLSAIPVVAASSWIIKLFGHTKIFMTSLILYGVRFLAYSFVYDPYLILPVEILEAFTFSLTWVVATIYSGKVAPAFVATLQGLIGAMHYSVGRGIGSLIAGALFDHYPARFVYQVVAGASTGCGVVYAVLHYLWLRKAPDPKISTTHSDDTKFASENSQKAQDSEEQLDQVHSALLEIDHPYQIPLSATVPHDNEINPVSTRS